MHTAFHIDDVAFLVVNLTERIYIHELLEMVDNVALTTKPKSNRMMGCMIPNGLR